MLILLKRCSLMLLPPGAHLLPNSIALSAGSLFAGFVSPPLARPSTVLTKFRGQVIRKTGRYYWLIAITSAFPIFALTAFVFLDEKSGWVHTWLSILPSGFGFASVITAGLSEYLFLVLSSAGTLTLPASQSP